MKDFHVTAPVAGTEADEPEALLQPPAEGEDNVARWKRVAKLAVLKSANQRWNQVVDSAIKSSQIGKSTSKASLQNQLSLKKAIEQAQKLTSKTVLPPVATIDLPESTTSTILNVLQDTLETDDAAPKAPVDTPILKLPVGPDTLVKLKTASSMDYVDEKQIKATQVPHRTPSGAIKRKPPNPTPAAYQQPNETTTLTTNHPTNAPKVLPSLAATQASATTDSMLSLPTTKSRIKCASPSKINLGILNTPEDKEKLVDVKPRSPRCANGKSPRKGGWL